MGVCVEAKVIGSVTGIIDLWMFALKRKFTVVASKVIAPAQETDKVKVC